MMTKTHQAFGLFASALAMHYIHTPILGIPAIAGMALGMATSIMPDADLANSVSAKSFLPLAWVLELLHITHRGATHSLFAAAFWWVLAIFGQHWILTVNTWHVHLYPVLIGMAAAYTSHIVIDFLNKEGEQLLWPLKGRYALHFAGADGVANKALEVVSMLAFLAVVLFGLGAEISAIRFIFIMAHHFSTLVPIP